MKRVLPEEIAAHYGVYGAVQEHRYGQTGAGHPPDEGSDDSEIEEGDNDSHEEDKYIIKGAEDSVEVLETSCPFDNDHLDLFQNALRKVQEEGIIPGHYRVLEEEWDEDEYSTIETLPSGRRGCWKFVVGLPDDIWHL